MASLTRKEIRKLRKKLKENWIYQIQFGLFSFFIGLAITYIPVGFIELFTTKIKLDFKGSIQDHWSLAYSYFFILLWVLMTSFIFYHFRIARIKKDLKYKKKITTKVELTFIEKLEELHLKNKDSVLHFDNDEIQVKKVYFNSKKKPEYLSATHALVEYAVFSKFHFKTRVLCSKVEG